MVQLTCIYTRSGDNGKTSLSTGKRVAKHDIRVQSYGTIDETNTVIGVARLYTRLPESADVDAMLMRIQNDLFDLGADLCTPFNGNLNQSESTCQELRITESQVERLEYEIDLVNKCLPALQSFVLPGGTQASAYLHQARSVCRRAERLLTKLMETEPGKINSISAKYLNRLSDHLFVLARYTNNHGLADVLWIPGGNR